MAPPNGRLQLRIEDGGSGEEAAVGKGARETGEVEPSPEGQGWMSGRPFPPPVRQGRGRRYFSTPDEGRNARVINLVSKVPGTICNHNTRGTLLPVPLFDGLLRPVLVHSLSTSVHESGLSTPALRPCLGLFSPFAAPVPGANAEKKPSKTGASSGISRLPGGRGVPRKGHHPCGIDTDQHTQHRRGLYSEGGFRSRTGSSFGAAPVCDPCPSSRPAPGGVGCRISNG